MNDGLGYVVAVEGLSAMRGLDSIPKDVTLAAMRAVNKATDRARTSSSKLMREQVDFPARYLSGQDGRLEITQRATEGNLEAAITGRFRPTSLARFARSGTPGKNGVRVEVAPGFAKLMRRAFLIRLRAGTADLDTKSNLGLAIRLKPGETIQNKKKAVQLKNGLVLLYGPSVDQVFRTVASDVAPETADFLEAEFLRLMELDQ
jgi:hypothetical protein